MNKTHSFENRVQKSRTHPPVIRAAWVSVLFALLLSSALIAACQPQALSYDELAELFVEEDWLAPSATPIGVHIGSNNHSDQNSISPSSGNPSGGINDNKTGAKPTSTQSFSIEKSFLSPGDDEDATATVTPTVIESTSPTENETPTPTSTPTRVVHQDTPTPTQTQGGPWTPPSATPTRRSATATPTPRTPSATPTLRVSTSTPTTVPPTATKTTVPPTATSATCSFSSNASFETTLIALINQERANQGIAPLTTSSQLTAAARQHSRDMACNDFFSHTGSDGSSPFDRMAWSGFSFTAAAENIYAGSGSYNSPHQAFNGWMNSSGHRTNMLNPTYTHVGIGYIYNASSTYGGYFTANFARP